MNQAIIIHEFSTGIEIFGTPDEWYIGNFTGNYINSTLSAIPASVQDAISGGYLKITEGKSSNKPAVVGREISRNLEQWSVVAVVTKGQEKSGRSGSLYRYFLSEGLGNIAHILQWMYQKKGGLLVFNPFDRQETNSSHQYTINSSHPNLDKAINKLQHSLIELDSTTIVPSHQACSPIILNEMANRICESPISWAFNVQGLDKPKSFQIIQPADFNSEQIVKQIISKTPKKHQFQGEENQIAKAIQGLTYKKIDSDYLQTIENELANSILDDEKLRYLFDLKGANDAITSKIYSEKTVKLLTLRAMVLPETLPEFLSWLEQSNNSEHYDISSSFQSEVLPHCKSGQLYELKRRITDGVLSIIPCITQKPQLLDSIYRLLTDKRGIWKYCYKSSVLETLDNDFAIVSQYYKNTIDNTPYKILNSPNWISIYNSLRNFWQPNALKPLIPEYQPLADLFDKLSTSKNERGKSRIEELKLCALFQYVSQGTIPNKTFQKLKRNSQLEIRYGLHIKVHGIWLKRQVPLHEQLYVHGLQTVGEISRQFQKIWNSKISFPIMMFIILTNNAIFFGLLSVFNENSIALHIPLINRTIKIGKDSNPDVSTTDSPTSGDTQGDDYIPSAIDAASRTAFSDISDDQMNEAYRRFDETKEVIKNEIFQPLFDEYKSVDNPQDIEGLATKIKKAIKITLYPQKKLNLQYDSAIESDINAEGEETYKQHAEKWIEAIYFYQQKKKQEQPSINVEGYLVPRKGQTNKFLKEDVRNNIPDQFKPSS